MSNTIPQIEQRLQEKLAPLHLEILDDSAKHAGHAGAKAGGGHYILTIVSKAFEGKSLLEQHQMVNEALQDLFQHQIHALALKTYSPSQWK